MRERKIQDFVTRRDASRGRKSNAGGGIKSNATQLYTPLMNLIGQFPACQTLKHESSRRNNLMSLKKYESR